MATTRIVSRAELSSWVHTRQNMPVELVLVMGGERLSVCDEGVVVEEGGEIVSAASIAPQGEGTGEPTIVGVFTNPEHRRKGYARQAFKAAVARCRERGLIPVRVDVLSSAERRIIDTLSEEERVLVVDHDMVIPGVGYPLDSTL